MFGLLFKNKIKILLRNKAMLFWTLIFPFVLGTFFQLALSNVDEAYKMNVFPIAVVEDNNYNNSKVLKIVVESLSEKGDNQIFNTSYVDKNEAESLLKNSKIEGYIIVNENGNPQIVIKENGINQTIMKSVLDEYNQMMIVSNDVIQYNPNAMYNEVMQQISTQDTFIKDTSKEKIDFSINYFFTLIAMTCLYGSLIGLEVIKDCEANLSKKGARICMCPVNKLKIIIISLLAGYIIQLIALAALFAFLISVFKVNFGNQVIPTMILSAIGGLAGTSLGTFVGVCNKKSEGFKIGILISVTMLCCFFSGMMGTPQLKSFFDEKMPIFAKINPINIITDGLYALFAYDTLTVFYECLLRISIFALTFIILTFIFVRRKKYDSI
nr:ABC transporter permease [Clostridia bacterium]